MLERRLWIAVLRAQRDLGIDVPDGDRGLRARRRAGRPRLDRRARAGHPPRRQGADRGVQRAGRARAHAQGHDQPRPHRERRAAADPALPGARPRPHGRRARPAGPPRRRARRAGDRPGAATTSPRRPPRSASGSRRRPTSCSSPTRGWRTCAPATRCAGSRARWAPRRTCSTCSAATPAKLAELEEPRRRAPRLRRRAHQRRPGLPPLAGLRRGHRARPARRRAVVAGHDDPADGRRRAGHRGLPARARSARRRCRTR